MTCENLGSRSSRPLRSFLRVLFCRFARMRRPCAPPRRCEPQRRRSISRIRSTTGDGDGAAGIGAGAAVTGDDAGVAIATGTTVTGATGIIGLITGATVGIGPGAIAGIDLGGTAGIAGGDNGRGPTPLQRPPDQPVVITAASELFGHRRFAGSIPASRIARLIRVRSDDARKYAAATWRILLDTDRRTRERSHAIGSRARR
jgi:hypothetical protein